MDGDTCPFSLCKVNGGGSKWEGVCLAAEYELGQQ